MATSSLSGWNAPYWVHNLYARFPLVVHEQEYNLVSRSITLWIHPPSPTHPRHRSWASSDPDSLRTQLLFLLRGVRIAYQSWANEAAVPGGTLPTLQLSERLVAADDIRAWLDENYPLKGKGKQLQGMPDQETYDKAMAIAQLVLVRLQPLYLTAQRSQDQHLRFSNPPPLSAGLITPLPASFTGNTRVIDHQAISSNAIGALEALTTMIGDGWALNTKHPTPLDALICANLHVMYGHPGGDIQRSLEENEKLGAYMDRVLDVAEKYV